MNTEASKLLELADRYCIATGGSEQARAQWRIDIEQTPAHLYQGLRSHLQKEMPAPAPAKLSAPPKRVPVTAALAWPKANNADQAHFWACTECRTGNKCAEGQRLNDLYMEVALREGRLVATRCAPKKTTAHWSVHATWRQADRDYKAHRAQCPTCKATARGHSARCDEGTRLYAIYEQGSEKKRLMSQNFLSR